MFIFYGRISLKGLRNNGFSLGTTILNSAVFILNCWLNVCNKNLAKNWGLRKIKFAGVVHSQRFLAYALKTRQKTFRWVT